eukprot:4601281-Prymnesium_polylepis.1
MRRRALSWVRSRVGPYALHVARRRDDGAARADDRLEHDRRHLRAPPRRSHHRGRRGRCRASDRAQGRAWAAARGRAWCGRWRCGKSAAGRPRTLLGPSMRICSSRAASACVAASSGDAPHEKLSGVGLNALTKPDCPSSPNQRRKSPVAESVDAVPPW